MKFISNNGTDVMYVGGKAIPPGEGREVEDDVLPPEHRDAVAAPAPEDAVGLYEAAALLLVGSVDVVKARLAEQTKETLDLMQELESAAKKPRASLLTALADAQIALADAKLKGEDLGKAEGAAA